SGKVIVTSFGSAPGVVVGVTEAPSTSIVFGFKYPFGSDVVMSNSILVIVSPPVLVIVHVFLPKLLKQVMLVVPVTFNCGAFTAARLMMWRTVPFTLLAIHLLSQP